MAGGSRPQALPSPPPPPEDVGSDWDSEGSGSSAFDEYEPSDDEDEYVQEAPPSVADNDEEADIAQEDFTRLIRAFQDEPGAEKGTASKGAAARSSSAWKQSMEAEMESFHHELRDVNGYTRKNKTTRIREQALSSEVKALLAQANISYVEANLPMAIQQLEEVIRIEPTVAGAWYTLGMCFEELGEEEKSIQCRIVGAHLTSNASDEWKSLARRSRERRQFIACFSSLSTVFNKPSRKTGTTSMPFGIELSCSRIQAVYAQLSMHSWLF